MKKVLIGAGALAALAILVVGAVLAGGLYDRFTSVEAKVSTHEGQLFSADGVSRVTVLETRVAAATSSLTTLTADVGGLKADVTNLRADAESAKSRVATAEENVSRLLGETFNKNGKSVVADLSEKVADMRLQARVAALTVDGWLKGGDAAKFLAAVKGLRRDPNSAALRGILAGYGEDPDEVLALAYPGLTFQRPPVAAAAPPPPAPQPPPPPAPGGQQR